MSIKMRVLYYSNKGKMETLARTIADKFELAINAVDVIPPAYSCDKERLVIMGISVGDEPADQLRLFCRELTKVRTQNVALYVDGKPAGIQKIKDALKEAGTNVIEETFTVKGGLPFKFAKSASDEEKAAILAWAERVVAQLQ
ncbi:MAG: flavodoxin domain-containing protein [Clostridia bacterium]|nr:flavodoxin domain-containing protein [Clostridia bacterium]